MNCPYITSWTLAKIWQMLWSHIKLRTAPIITIWNFLKNKNSFVEVIWKFKLPLSSQAGLFPKIRQIWKCHWKIEPALLSRGKILAKIGQFPWCDLNIWPFPIITSGNFLKNKADLLKRFGNLNCSYYRWLKFSHKWGSFDDITLKFELSLH